MLGGYLDRDMCARLGDGPGWGVSMAVACGLVEKYEGF